MKKITLLSLLIAYLFMDTTLLAGPFFGYFATSGLYSNAEKKARQPWEIKSASKIVVPTLAATAATIACSKGYADNLFPFVFQKVNSLTEQFPRTEISNNTLLGLSIGTAVGFCTGFFLARTISQKFWAGKSTPKGPQSHSTALKKDKQD